MSHLLRAYRPGEGFCLFRLRRAVDVSGVSGTGVVAVGVTRADGGAVMRWLSATPSDGVYRHWRDIEAIHGHAGATRVEWIDESPADSRAPQPVPSVPTETGPPESSVLTETGPPGAWVWRVGADRAEERP